jgi:hypothetical protein
VNAHRRAQDREVEIGVDARPDVEQRCGGGGGGKHPGERTCGKSGDEMASVHG